MREALKALPRVTVTDVGSNLSAIVTFTVASLQPAHIVHVSLVCDMWPCSAGTWFESCGLGLESTSGAVWRVDGDGAVVGRTYEPKGL